MTAVVRRIAAIAASLALSVTLATVPQAAAQQRNLVSFGDSVMADPRADNYLTERVGSDLGSSGSSQNSYGTYCPTGYNYAKRAGAKLGLPVRDYSCSGAASMSRGKQISAQVDAAIRSGALNSATSRVIFTSGFNDTYNNRELSQAQMRAKFVRFTAPQIERIKRAAPNARIQIVGYTTITDRGNLCLLHTGGSSAGPIYSPEMRAWENASQWMLVDLARATGTQFVDLKPSTRGNHMCAPNNRRMWAGLVDFSGGPGNLPFHLNARGHAHVANVIARS